MIIMSKMNFKDNRNIVALFLVFIMGMAAVGQVSAIGIPSLDIELFVHYVKELITEKISELIGVGSTAKTDIQKMERDMSEEGAKANIEEPLGSVESVGTTSTTQPPGDTAGTGSNTAVSTTHPDTTITTTTITTRTTTTISRIMYWDLPYRGSSSRRSAPATAHTDKDDSGSIWDDRFDECTHVIDIINSDAHVTDKLNDIGDETVLVAIVDDGRLQWERKMGMVKGRIMKSRSGEPTVWIKVDAEAAESLYHDLKNGAGRDDLIRSAIGLWKKDKIEIYPVSKAGKMYGGLLSIIAKN